MESLSHLQGNLPDPGIEARSPALQEDSLPAELPGKPLLPCLPTDCSDLKSPLPISRYKLMCVHRVPHLCPCLILLHPDPFVPSPQGSHLRLWGLPWLLFTILSLASLRSEKSSLCLLWAPAFPSSCWIMLKSSISSSISSPWLCPTPSWQWTLLMSFCIHTARLSTGHVIAGMKYIFAQ